jgi:hypothetical protein
MDLSDPVVIHRSGADAMTLAALSNTVNAVKKAARAYSEAPEGVEAAIRQASARTGVDFSYLMEKAAVESSFRTDLKASTSSATGLYQFIDSTWLNTLKQHGEANGLGRYAKAIETRADGRSFVADPAMRQEIMELRKDPKVSALMAAEFTRDNKEYLEKNTSGPVGATELYMAHFLGAGGASKFLNAMRESPNRQAKELFPDAAASNHNVFYNKASGEPATLKQIYDRFSKKFSEDGDVVSAGAAARRIQYGMPDGFETQVPDIPAKALRTSPLSMYQVLALNALETPDETSLTGKSEVDRRNEAAAGGKDKGRVRNQPIRSEQTGDTHWGLGLGREGGQAMKISA